MGFGKIFTWTYSYFGGGRGQTHSYVIFSKSIFYIRNRVVKWFGRYHILFESGRKKSIRMSCFLLILQRMNSVKYNFSMLKNEMESYVRIGGRGLKNLTYPYMGIGGSKIAKIILT